LTSDSELAGDYDTSNACATELLVRLQIRILHVLHVEVPTNL
jgi:hypothetical protein